MRYLVTIDKDTNEASFNKIIDKCGTIIYKSILLPLIIVESIDRSVLKSLKFVKDIEEDYYGELAHIDAVQVRPKINFGSIRALLDYRSTKIAVIDSGIDNNHGLNIVNSTDYTSTKINSEKHGTKVASIINLVTPGIQLLNAKITNDTSVSASNAIQAMEWALIEGANVINMSMGFVQLDSNGRRIRCKGDCYICKLVEQLAAKNILVVTAAGNDGPANGTISCPSNSRYSISVGSINLNERLVEYSSRGRIGQNKPDLITSGFIFTKENDLEGGTSFAAPIITGIAAGIFQRFKHINRIKEVILNSTKSIGYEYYEEGKGKFEIDKLKEVLNYEKNASAN